LEDLGLDRKILLEWILGKYVEKLWIEYIWLRIGTSFLAFVTSLFFFSPLL